MKLVGKGKTCRFDYVLTHFQGWFVGSVGELLRVGSSWFLLRRASDPEAAQLPGAKGQTLNDLNVQKISVDAAKITSRFMMFIDFHEICGDL